MTLTAEDHAAIDDMWTRQPRRPKMPGLAPLQPGTPTVTITCRVCGTRSGVEISAPARLCRECAHDLAATRQHAETMLAAVVAREAAASEHWTQYLAGLDDALSARFDRVWSDRAAAETRLRQAERARVRAEVSDAELAQRVVTARAELEMVKARIAKTRANSANPLAAVLEAEAQYHEAVAQCREEKARWETALQEIEAAETGGVPF